MWKADGAAGAKTFARFHDELPTTLREGSRAGSSHRLAASICLRLDSIGVFAMTFLRSGMVWATLAPAGLCLNRSKFSLVRSPARVIFCALL
jgi:hypothetical protein